MLDKSLRQKSVNNKKEKLARFSLWALMAMSCYQLGLCFLSTNVMPVSNVLLGGIELLVLASVFVKIWPHSGQWALQILGAALVYFLALYALRIEVNLYALRNVIVIVLFYLLGKQVGDIQVANRVVKWICYVVLFFASVEYFFTDIYLRYFNILQYNIARGAIVEKASEFMDQNLAVNGIRFVGRNLLPFLGNQRVSSVFLEPVSMGNFATLLSIWFLSLDVKDWSRNRFFLLMGLVFIVACDSRFASISLFFLLLVRFVPFLQRSIVIASFPFWTVFFLMAFSYFGFGRVEEDNLTGRLARSGQTLWEIDLLGWFGFRVPRSLADMGVSYTIEHFGCLLIFVLWSFFSFVQIKNSRGQCFRSLFSIYILSLLMISGTSFYSAKTASLAWFLMGILSAEDVDDEVSRVDV